MSHAAIHRLLEQNSKKEMPTLSLTVNILCSIPGIELLTAATIVAEVGDFSAFSKPDKLVAIIFAVVRDKKLFVLRKPADHAKMLAAKNLAA